MTGLAAEHDAETTENVPSAVGTTTANRLARVPRWVTQFRNTVSVLVDIDA